MRAFRKLKSVLGHAYSSQSGQINPENEEPYIPIYNIMYDQSGMMIISGDDAGLIKIWSAETGLLLGNMKGHCDNINSISVSPDNRFIASCSKDGTARVWDPYDLRPVAVFKENENEPMATQIFYKEKDVEAARLFLITGSD